MRLTLFLLIAVVKFPQTCVSIALDCHKEQEFVKVDQGMLCFISNM